MIKVPGTISINTVKGRHGAFNVGVLSTDLGDFSVKDEVLDEHNSGVYEGEFLISQITLGYFGWGNTKHVVELRARLASIDLECKSVLVEAKTGNNHSPLSEHDPIDDEPVKTSPADGGDPLEGETRKLFLQKAPIKLDPSVGRAVFREQTQFLRANNYQYDALSKTWSYQQ